MDNPSFAEIKEKFSKMNVLPFPKPVPPTTTNNESTPIDISAPNRPKTENVNHSYDTVDTTTIAAPTVLPSQTPNETSFSSSREAIKAHLQQRCITNIPTVKKPPVPLPPVVAHHRNETTSSEPSSVSESLLLKPVLLPSVNILTVPEASSIAVPSTVGNESESESENIYAELSNDFSDSAASSNNISQDTNEYISLIRPIVPLPNPINVNRHEIPPTESLSVALDTMLPPKCIFLEAETLINGYKRKDPRTIIYPRIESSMPKITTEEINTLQRYLNT